MIVNFHCRVRQPWKHKARQNFIENQIETCKMLKSADELQVISFKIINYNN